MQRDPLWQKLKEIKASQRKQEDWKPGGRVDQLRDTLEYKYGVYWVSSSRPQATTTRRVELIIPNKYAEQDGFFIPYWPTIMAFVARGKDPITLPKFPPPCPTRPLRTPRLLIEVDLERVGFWDLAALTDRFREVVRAGLKKLKKGNGPPAIAPFRYTRLKTFRRDLRRYDLHMTYGLSFRLIALTEDLERRGKKVPENLRRVGRPIRTESGVRRSVHRIYRAIYGKRYNAKRRRLDHPAQGFKPYSCPHHPRKRCDMKCEHLRKWLKAIKPTLPSDKTGIGPVWKPSVLTDNILSLRPDARRNRKALLA